MTIKNSVTKTMIIKLIAVLIMFSLCRLLFLVFNFDYFYTGENGIEIALSFFFGLRFDLSTVAYLNSLFIIFSLLPFPFREKRYYQRFTNIFYYIPNILGFISEFGDIIYFRFTGKRTTADFFSFISEGDNFLGLIPQFLEDYWYMFLIAIGLTTLFVVTTNKLLVRQPPIPEHKLPWFFRRIILLALFLALLVLGMRGGFQLRPINIMSATKHVQPRLAPLVLNTPFTIMRTLSKSGLSEKKYFTPEEAKAIFDPNHNFQFTADIPQKNIVIIILESFSREHSGLYGNSSDSNYLGFMPFLDSLSKKGRYFRCFANGRRSMVGIPAIVSGLPSLMNGEFLTSSYAGNNINSIAKAMKQNGHKTAFFHGGINGTLGLDNYSKSAGFDYYFGKDEYNNDEDFDGKWGIFDEPFLQFTAQILDTITQPFTTTIFTLSAHHPYTIPKEHIGEFRKGELPIQETVMYSDYALRKFFEKAKTSTWYNNTIFVITADHASESISEYYKNPVGQYEIPLIFFSPTDTLPIPQKEFAQQTDIFPTAAKLNNYNGNIFAFGNNLFDSKNKPFAISYRNGNYQLIKDNFVLNLNDDKPISLYNMSTDSLLKNNIILDDSINATKLTLFLKSIVQQYNNAMIHNKMTNNE